MHKKAASFDADPDRTYPRVLPASLPSVSEPDRNQGGSLVLPGLGVLPVPEPLLNFELETKDEEISYKPMGPRRTHEKATWKHQVLRPVWASTYAFVCYVFWGGVMF